MTEKEVMKGNIKLEVFDSFPYERLKEVCDTICKLGFDCEYLETGTIVFTDKKNKTED